MHTFLQHHKYIWNETADDRSYNEVIFVELTQGILIRGDQYQLHDNISTRIHSNIENLSNVTKYNVEQMLMGKGKTAIITPLLIFKYIFNPNIQNIFIVLPTHLINQTFNMIQNKLYYVMNHVEINKYINPIDIQVRMKDPSSEDFEKKKYIK